MVNNAVHSPHLISAPVPGGLNGESKHQARPRQVSCDRIPEDMEGVRTGLVAALADVPRDGRDGVHVAMLEVFITSHLVESCGHVRKLFKLLNSVTSNSIGSVMKTPYYQSP